jgi:membrane protein required for beta-lactamase induction
MLSIVTFSRHVIFLSLIFWFLVARKTAVMALALPAYQLCRTAGVAGPLRSYESQTASPDVLASQEAYLQTSS